MAEPHQFNEASTFCLLQNGSPLTADMFFSHPKKRERKKTSKAEKQAARTEVFLFFLKLCLRKKMQQDVQRHKDTTGDNVLHGNKA